MSSTLLTHVEPGHRIQLPADWVDALGLHDQVVLSRTEEGILVRPCPPPCPSITWEEIFATKLAIGASAPNGKEDAVEVSGDDFVF